MPVFVIIFLFGCGATTVPVSEHISKAKTNFQNKQLRAAIIELKNALQQEPSNYEARFLLGKYYLETKNGVDAEKELMRAKEIRSGDPQLDMLIVQSLRVQSKYEEITKAFPLELSDIKKENTPLAVFVADANLILGDIEKAEKIIENVSSIDPTLSTLQLVKLKIDLRKNKIKEATSSLTALLESQPDMSEAWMIKGNIEYLNGNYVDAAEAFEKVIIKSKNDAMHLILFSAYVGKIRSLLAESLFEKAEVSINQLSSKASKHPIPLYYKGLLSYQKKDYSKAKENIQLVLNQLPDHLPSHLILGTINYIDGNLEQASVHLTKYVGSNPSHLQARKILAAVQVKQGRTGDALDLLEPITESKQDDAALLAMVGQLAVVSGDLLSGREYLQKATKAFGKTDARISNELVKISLAQGEFAQAEKELKKLAKTHPRQAKFLLSNTFLQKKEFKKARKIAKELLAESPKDIAARFLLASIYLREGDMINARKQYKRIMEVEGSSVQAHLGLASIELNEGKTSDAKTLFEKVLSLDPKNDIAMIGSAQIAEANGNIEDALAWLEKARKNGQSGLIARMLLARYHLSKNQLGDAEEIAKEAFKKNPTDQRAIQLLTQVQLRKGEGDAASSTIENIINQRPNDPISYVKSARVQLTVGNASGAEATIQKALAIDKNNFDAQVTLAAIKLKQKKSKDAITLAKKVKQKNSKLAVGHVIHGDALMQLQQFNKAKKEYQKAVKKQYTASNVVKLSSAIKNTGDKKGAIKPLSDWIKKNPKDIKTKIILSTAHQSVGDLSAAGNILESIIEVQPENPIALNNLSWIYYEQKDKRAINLAEKAHKLLPQAGAITDTYGWISLFFGETNRGVELLEKAAKQTNSNPDIMYHLAFGLNKQGKKDKAKQILAEVLEKHNNFSEREKAEKLLKSL